MPPKPCRRGAPRSGEWGQSSCRSLLPDLRPPRAQEESRPRVGCSICLLAVQHPQRIGLKDDSAQFQGWFEIPAKSPHNVMGMEDQLICRPSTPIRKAQLEYAV